MATLEQRKKEWQKGFDALMARRATRAEVEAYHRDHPQPGSKAERDLITKRIAKKLADKGWEPGRIKLSDHVGKVITGEESEDDVVSRFMASQARDEAGGTGPEAKAKAEVAAKAFQPSPFPGGGGGGSPSSDPYATFNAAFERAFGRPITQEEQSDNAFVEQLSNDLFRLLPIDRQIGFDAKRLSELSNDDLNKVLTRLLEVDPKALDNFSGERLAKFPADAIAGFIKHLEKINPDSPLAKELRSGMPPGSPEIPPPAAPGAPPTPAPGPTPFEEIPATHAWLIEIGASEWALKLRAQGIPWDQITTTRLRADMKAAWEARKSDPKFAKLWAYAQEYYTRTGHWPTEVEINRFTQHIKGVPAITPDGMSVVPKKGEAGGGEYPPWEIPTGPDGNPIPLPPGYDWYFGPDGTPIPLDKDPTHKDLFAGWYQDPRTGQWTYNPLLGAADYLQGTSQEWTNAINDFVDRTGRLPTLEEARSLSAKMWSSVDEETRKRATQFAEAHGHWPTPFELEFGPAKDTDANEGGGVAGQPGMGKVPVFVPGIGMVLADGMAVGPGGFAFDPFQGIPGAIRPFIREILDGRMKLDDIPPEMRDWALFALAQFKSQIPQKRREELHIPEATPDQPTTIDFGSTQPIPEVEKVLNEGALLTAWKTTMPPGTPEPTKEQMNSVAFLSQLDPSISKHVSPNLLRQFPPEAIARFDNDTLINLVPDSLGKLSNERLAQFGKDYLNATIKDPRRRSELGLRGPEEAVTPNQASKEEKPKPVTTAQTGAMPAPAPSPPLMAPSTVAPVSTGLALPLSVMPTDFGTPFKEEKENLIGLVPPPPKVEVAA